MLKRGQPYELIYEKIPTGGWRSESQRIKSLAGLEHLVPEIYRRNMTKIELEGIPIEAPELELINEQKEVLEEIVEDDTS